MNDTLQALFKALISLRNSTAAVEQAEAIVFLDFCRRNLQKSNSQILQDLFVQHELRDRRGGYFVEFGASDGLENSNTLMLERQFGWNGLLAEPGTGWHAALRANRRCRIDLRCVWEASGRTLEFNEVKNPGLGGLSTIHDFVASDAHARLRENASVYPVTTVSLNDLLAEHDAPRTIDYMSVDTEGSELRILSQFDFDAWDVRIMTIEHNHTPLRQPIHDFMVSKGYRRKFELYSGVDDWYVKP